MGVVFISNFPILMLSHRTPSTQVCSLLRGAQPYIKPQLLGAAILKIKLESFQVQKGCFLP